MKLTKVQRELVDQMRQGWRLCQGSRVGGMPGRYFRVPDGATNPKHPVRAVTVEALLAGGVVRLGERTPDGYREGRVWQYVLSTYCSAPTQANHRSPFGPM